MTETASKLIAAASTVAALGDSFEAVDALANDDVLAGQAALTALHQASQMFDAWYAGSIARRSRHELGYSGLAKEQGFSDTESLIQSITGGTRAEASKLVKVGTMVNEVANVAATLAADPSAPFDVPWQQPVVEALFAGTLSTDAAESIRRGLGGIDDAVTVDVLRSAAEVLLLESSRIGATGLPTRGLNADQLFTRARALRDDLDAEGIARREKQRYADRAFWARRRPDGMVVGGFCLADEDAALMMDIADAATHPKRGRVTFDDDSNDDRNDDSSDDNVGDGKNVSAVDDDPRTRQQLLADAISALLRIGVDADPNSILGKRRPAVRVVVTARSLRKAQLEPALSGPALSGSALLAPTLPGLTLPGHGRIEAMADPVSIETIERHLCDSGTIGVMFDDDGACLNVGKEQRLFTQRQRIGLALRDGGCRIGHCDKPPSWCEAHHIDYWARDDGKTDIADGILLCRFHHMLIHNNHWTITRSAGQYWLTPPPNIDPARTPRPMHSTSPTIRDLRRELEREREDRHVLEREHKHELAREHQPGPEGEHERIPERKHEPGWTH